MMTSLLPVWWLSQGHLEYEHPQTPNVCLSPIPLLFSAPPPPLPSAPTVVVVVVAVVIAITIIVATLVFPCSIPRICVVIAIIATVEVVVVFVGRVAFHDLGGHVDGGADHGVLAVRVVMPVHAVPEVGLLAAPEVRQFHLALVQQHVRCLDVPVNHSAAVQVLEL